jgi:hypothetical protein
MRGKGARSETSFASRNACQKAAGITADNDFDLLRQGGVHQTLQGAIMVRKSVATGQQKTVRLRFAQIKGQLAGFDLVHPQAPALDHVLLAQAVNRALDRLDPPE